MVKDSDRRGVHYDKKLDPDVQRQRITAERDFMIEQMHIRAAQQFFIETKIKDYLEQIGFYGIEQHHYMNFAQECWRLSRTFTGATLQKEVEIKADKWMRRNLEATHLLAIARMFGVELVSWP